MSTSQPRWGKPLILAWDGTAIGTMSSRRCTFLLLHGSWHGGWCWDRLTPLLVQRGHRVVAPTLVGLGELADQARPDTGLSVHIAQVEALLGDMTDVTLVGHSYAGLILTALADRQPERIRSLVYLDALLAEDGQSCFDVMPGTHAAFQAAAERAGSGWLVPPMSARDFGVLDPQLAQWVDERLTPMPIRTHEEPLHAPRGTATELRRVYVSCTQFGFDGFAQKARAEHFDQVASVDAGHDVQVTQPVRLSQLLDELA